MPTLKAKARANVSLEQAPVTGRRTNTRANEDVVQEMLKHLGPCCKEQAVRESWTTWEIEDGACFRCYEKLMQAGLV